MNLITARNVHEMLPVALDRLFKTGVSRNTRNGPVLQMPGPTILCYERPTERVVFWPERNANPFFHLWESLWMLAGREDVDLPARFVAGMKRYSDDGKTFNGAYGYRWRSMFGFDQLEEIEVALRNNPDCRRQVLQMWSASQDLGRSSADLPCNTHAYFAVNNGTLDLTVCNRSNDLVWGALGANAVHFSFLLEHMAERIGVAVGKYYQFTNNLHGYLNTLDPLRDLPNRVGEASPYDVGLVKPVPLGVLEITDLAEYLNRYDRGLKLGQTGQFFLDSVATPMAQAYECYKNKQWGQAMQHCSEITATDWQMASAEWLTRAWSRYNKAKDDGVSYDEVNK